jgi:hypothetical protein
MAPDTLYTSVGVTPDAQGIVIQTVYWNGRPHFPYIISFVDIGSCLLGTLLLTGLKAYHPVIDTLAAALIPETIGPLTVHVHDYSGRKRAAHLRVQVISQARSLVIERFDGDAATGDQARHVMLAPLMDRGPEAVADAVGCALLSELAALHPDVFQRLPLLGR